MNIANEIILINKLSSLIGKLTHVITSEERVKVLIEIKEEIEVYLKDYQNIDNKKDNITKRTPNKI